MCWRNLFQVPLVLFGLFFVSPIQAFSFTDLQEYLNKLLGECSVQTKHIQLSEKQRNFIQGQSQKKVATNITYYLAQKADQPLAYAFIDTHRVRTRTESLLIVVGTEGRVIAIKVLRFLEPTEYKASQRWLDTLNGKGLSSPLRMGVDLDAISGATMTTIAVSKAVKKALWLTSIFHSQNAG